MLYKGKRNQKTVVKKVNYTHLITKLYLVEVRGADGKPAQIYVRSSDGGKLIKSWVLPRQMTYTEAIAYVNSEEGSGNENSSV